MSITNASTFAGVSAVAIKTYGINENFIPSIVEDTSSSSGPKVDFITRSINDFRASETFKDMVEGQRYYSNKNDILKSKRFVLGRDGEKVEAQWLANNNLPHGFMRKLVRQKVGYLLSKPFSITTDVETFEEPLGKFFTTNMRRMFKASAQEAIIRGIGWLQAFYDTDGNLNFKRIPAHEVIPFWGDADHTVLNAAIRVYFVDEFFGADVKRVEHVQYFAPEGMYNYVFDESGLQPNAEKPFESYFQVVANTDTSVVPETPSIEGEERTTDLTDAAWDQIPLIPLKYNAEEASLLTFIKPLIDDYDKRTSSISNTLEEEPDKIKIVKNYDGTNKGEFMYNLMKYRTLFLRDSGDVTTLDTSISIDAATAHIERVRKDIFEFGGGVDTQTKDLGSASGVALKFIYSDVDMDCQDFGAELAWAIEQMVWYLKVDLQLKDIGDFVDASVEVAFNTDITINELETVEILEKSADMLSRKTRIQNHPYVSNVSAEEAQLDLEEEEASARAEEEARKISESMPTKAVITEKVDPVATEPVAPLVGEE